VRGTSRRDESAEQQQAAVGGGELAPRRQGGRRGIDGCVDVRSPALGDLGDHRVVVWVEHVELAAVGGIDELTADEQPILGVAGGHQKSTG
jgi:hypothetical protein